MEKYLKKNGDGYQFIKLKFMIMEKNNFKLLEDLNGIINMHFTLQTENDKKLNDYQFDLLLF